MIQVYKLQTFSLEVGENILFPTFVERFLLYMELFFVQPLLNTNLKDDYLIHPAFTGCETSISTVRVKPKTTKEQ